MADDAVRVYARPRPQAQTESSSPACLWLEESASAVHVRPRRPDQHRLCPSGDQTFDFDGVLSEVASASQGDVYRRCAARVVASALEGYNGAVMAYGQTGAGKTYTMAGRLGAEPGDVSRLAEGDTRGVTQRAIEDVMKAATASSASPMTVSASFLEIYNDNVVDLLQDPDRQARCVCASPPLTKRPRLGDAPQPLTLTRPSFPPSFLPSFPPPSFNARARRPPQVHWNGGGVVSGAGSGGGGGDKAFAGGSRHPIATRDGAMALLRTGLKRRQMAGHKLNRDSSRSHAIFTLYISREAPPEATAKDGLGPSLLQSRLDLVDLAGKNPPPSPTSQILSSSPLPSSPLNVPALTCLGACISTSPEIQM